MKHIGNFKFAGVTRRGALRGLGSAGLTTALAASPLQFAGKAWAQSAPRPGTITTALSWIPNHQFAGLWVGLDKGWFNDAGVRVEWRPGGPNTPNGVERVASGEVSLGSQSGMRPVLEAITKGNDLVVVGSRFQHVPGGMLSLAKRPVLEAKDLIGKRLILPSPTDVRTIEIALKLNKLPSTPNTFQYVPGGFDPQALVDGQGDAMLAFVTNQPVALEAKGMVKDKDFFFRTWDELGLPSYSGFLFGTRKWVAENRDLLVRYLRTEIRGWVMNEVNPAYAAKLVVDKYGADFGLDLKREVRSNELQMPFLHSAETAKNGLFWVDRDRLGGAMYDGLRAGGLKRLPDIDKYLDMSLLRDARKA
ncbi:ABC transporter substrate-binding protein (plasmid) [Polaromonas sp. P1-6]|nr:ABC transporter substrate-binding protein [Polaromonas sp. P1-6]